MNKSTTEKNNSKSIFVYIIYKVWYIRPRTFLNQVVPVILDIRFRFQLTRKFQ